MSGKEIYPDRTEEERGPQGRRFAIILGAALLLVFALTVATLYAIFNGKLHRKAWPESPPASSRSAGGGASPSIIF